MAEFHPSSRTDGDRWVFLLAMRSNTLTQSKMDKGTMISNA